MGKTRCITRHARSIQRLSGCISLIHSSSCIKRRDRLRLRSQNYNCRSLSKYSEKNRRDSFTNNLLFFDRRDIEITFSGQAIPEAGRSSAISSISHGSSNFLEQTKIAVSKHRHTHSQELPSSIIQSVEISQPNMRQNEGNLANPLSLTQLLSTSSNKPALQ